LEEMVATLLSEEMQAGNYSRQWNAFDLPMAFISIVYKLAHSRKLKTHITQIISNGNLTRLSKKYLKKVERSGDWFVVEVF